MCWKQEEQETLHRDRFNKNIILVNILFNNLRHPFKTLSQKRTRREALDYITTADQF